MTEADSLKYLRTVKTAVAANPELLDGCARERASRRGDPDSPALMIHPDDAAMLLLEMLWHRLHC